MMAKLPNRIPSEQVKAAGSWPLEELTQGEGSKTFRLEKPIAEKTHRSGIRRPKKQETGQAKATKPKPQKPPETHKQEVPKQTVQQAEQTPSEPNQEPEPVNSLEPVNSPEPVNSLEPINNPEPEAVVESTPPPQMNTEDAGYQAGYQKGETEGYVKGEQTGYSAGLEAGTEEGRKTAEAAFNTEVANQKEVITNLTRAFSEPPRYEAGLEEALGTLVSEIAQVVLMTELKTEPEHVTNLVRQALKALPHHATQPKVFLNPSDVEWVEENLNADMQLVADASLARGGCRVETDESSIDGTLSSRIRAALLASLSDTATPGEAELQQLDSAIDP